ncbi:MAG: hypothetical protein RIB46_11580 [Pseudomonadales bacterium]
MWRRWLHRDRGALGVVLSGVLVLATYLAGASVPDGSPSADQPVRLLTGHAWRCEVHDPGHVAVSVSNFGADGRLEGVTRLEDRQTGVLLLEFRYRGRWHLDDPWLTEVVEDYQYLHVDPSAFSAERLAAIEAEFAEPEVSRLHLLSEAQLVFGADHALYQCHAREKAPTTST